MLSLIKKIYYDNYGVYGAKRIYEILKLRGHSIAYKTVYYQCLKNGLVSIRHKIKSLKIQKPVKEYTRSSHIVANNIIRLLPRTINEVWVTDWTRFYVESVTVYLYVIMDLFSRRIIGYGYNTVGETVDTQIEVLRETIISRSPSDNLTIHSDNEDGFKDRFYREIIDRLGINQSFNFVMCNNNFMESFNATFYKEFYLPSFLDDNYFIKKLTLDNFGTELKKYINFYNNNRAHSSLGYITPREYESTIRTYVPIKYRRQILHVDINACFAQYECILNPSLKGKNLVIIGEEYKRDRIIVCASLEARKYGIGCGDSLQYARFKCRDLVVRKSSKKAYQKISEKFFEILYHYSDRVEPYGIDEAWVDVTHSQLLFGSPLHIAELIMNELKATMGITVSIGLSYNKIYSKLASDLRKPNAITQIPYKYSKKIVYSLPVENLLFVGERTAEMFHFYGINTIGDLAFARFSDVKAIVGEKWANKLINYANGQEFSEVRLYGETVPIKSISKSDTLYANATDFDTLKKLIIRLSEDVGARLRDDKKVAYAIGVKLRDKYYKDHSIQTQLYYGTNSGMEISDEIIDLILHKMYGISTQMMSLKEYYELEHMKLKYEVRQAGVFAFKLRDEEMVRNSKYTQVENVGINRKYTQIDKAIDKINKKYDSKVIGIGSRFSPWYERFL